MAKKEEQDENEDQKEEEEGPLEQVQEMGRRKRKHSFMKKQAP